MTSDYHFFWSGPFSQWHQSSFSVWDRTFNTAEQAMMYGKAMLFDDAGVAEKILMATDPGKQKALGRQVRNFSESVWDREKVRLVTEVNLAKFDQNKGLRRKLFQTGDAVLVEASPMDTVWGIGLDERHARETAPDLWPGQNLLGQVLMDVRAKLRETYPAEKVAS